ncbi:tungstate transport system ATP-binding protein [Bathymodiolus platifrons methanotrophic gill symbiont]|uniref:ATP-binding cassette domain-containing protein n=1 Tax=Bathymodiolus platifrons methanotrophic gill symbiont TaxID=113268 RepID=UPI000B41E514|nr:ATP-binding cassette domain-containing protein [Bathymodiolus platifrons methanotrophic gill symbiont]TXL01887.1 molybdenum ABC transporter ATP-binding protein [Methylococcaceae bacterium HT1]TXL16164.1 molybdenum ABC transporter ATP-binding protein [Methylococcaceae bacterium HT4]TXL18010.1 molybdenum ABC transporter ATP-binding protein [Methylococcaceae bacterium HT3]TXL20268.1 molybdenum ABC transporter ATP-binding protein [Methylococcaceae bacterium HT5]TXL22569.1 molybdenum ABC transpo
MENIYQLNQLRFYYNDKPALSLDNIQLQAGKTTALIGANGSGKSTLLNMLAFLTSPAQGEILFNGQRVNKKGLVRYRRRVGFLAQKPFMLLGTVYDNIDLALKIQGKGRRSEKIIRVLKQLDIEHCIYQQAKLLSGGELQKVALARSLVLEPEVLLLDEPFSYLDQSSAQALETFLQGYTQETGHTLIFSTHNRLQGFALADKVLALADGLEVKTPLINLFHGEVEGHQFHSGSMSIVLSEAITTGRHASINPKDIVLSNGALESSMRNHFQGRIIMIADEMGSVRVSVDTGVVFKALITYQALEELKLNLGGEVWVNFKSSAVVVF